MPMMNVFDYINQYKKNSISIYANLLENKTNPENDLNSQEKTIYSQLKQSDSMRFKVNENKNLMNGVKIQPHPADISGIGKVIQIC